MIKPQAGARFKFRERLENHSVITVRNRIPIVEYCDAYKIDDIDPETGASPIILYKGCDRYGYEELRTFHHTIDIEKGWEITEEHHSPWQDSTNIFINLFANKTIDYTNSLEHTFFKEEKVLKDEEAFLLFFDREKKLIMRVTLNNYGNIFVSMKDYAIYINDTEESMWKTDYFYDYRDGEEWNKYIKYFDYTPLVVEPLKVEPLIFTKNPHGGEHLIEPPEQTNPLWLDEVSPVVDTDYPVIDTDKILTETLTFKQFNELVFDNNLEYTLENGVYTTRKGDITYITKVNNNEN